MLHRFETIADDFRDIHHIVTDCRIPHPSKPKELIVLNVHPSGRPRKIESVTVGASAKISHINSNMRRKILALPPHNPPCARTRLPKLVATRRDAQHLRHAEVPGRLEVLEGRDEASARSVDVDPELKAVLFVDSVELSCDLGDGVVLAAVVVSHDADHADRALVDSRLDGVRVDLERAELRRHQVRFDVHVAEQLLPGRLIHCRNHDVRGLFHLGRLLAVLFEKPRLPALLQRDAGQQTRLGAAHRPRSRVDSVPIELFLDQRAVPELCDHVDAVVVHFPAVWVHALVGEIDSQA
mmetsp:Transcript_30060/g.52787  ORF Transcript_30060/g.52787 Transcript_30060/m.52787 type:complete len:296 (+) Transcript_30060:547-1434(+)